MREICGSGDHFLFAVGLGPILIAFPESSIMAKRRTDRHPSPQQPATPPTPKPAQDELGELGQMPNFSLDEPTAPPGAAFELSALEDPNKPLFPLPTAVPVDPRSIDPSKPPMVAKLANAGRAGRSLFGSVRGGVGRGDGSAADFGCDGRGRVRSGAGFGDHRGRPGVRCDRSRASFRGYCRTRRPPSSKRHRPRMSMEASQLPR